MVSERHRGSAPIRNGISNERATAPPPEPVDMLAAMRKLMATIPPPEEIVARIEAGPIAQAAIRALATPAAATQPWEPVRFDLPICHPDPDDPFGHPHGCCWRTINAAGGVMREGCVWADAHARVEEMIRDL